jgi:hypothetical protein
LANGMKMWKGNKNTSTLLFSLKGLNILLKEGERSENQIMEHFDGILLHKSGLLTSSILIIIIT